MFGIREIGEVERNRFANCELGRKATETTERISIEEGNKSLARMREETERMMNELFKDDIID